MTGRILVWTLLVLHLAAAATSAQRPSATPLRLPAGTTVEVDGDLDEDFWQDAALLDELVLTEPVEGKKPSYPTEIRLAYDDDFFYIGLLCHDDPSEVRARQMDRDAFVRYDDVVEIWFDTFFDQRFAFWFQITAGGSRGDALLSDSGNSFNKSWDGIWYGRSKVTESGWQAELAFPFKTLGFKAGQETWGFNIRRKRIANGENARWASPFVAYDFFNLNEGGELRGMTGMQQGLGIDVVPYLKAAVGRDRTDDPGDDYDDDYDVGLDLSWRPTSSTQLQITTNTDFAETEVDQRQINLTRFPLFFPEKRDFFLEDAGLFEFGIPARGGSIRNVIPFFSRTVGRDPEGNAVPIEAGMKFTGRMGDWNIGVLETLVDDYRTDETGEVPEKNLGALRVSRNLGGESAVGMILTHGRPEARGSAYTIGADLRLGSSRFFGDEHSGSLWAYYLRSGVEGSGGEGAAYGVQARAQSASWSNTAEALVTEEGFDPKLGFVRRDGVAQFRYESQYTWRGGDESFIRRYRASVRPRYALDLEGHEDRIEVPLRWFELQFQSEDLIRFETRWIDETLDDGFDLSDDVFVEPGDYDMVRHVARFNSNDRRLYRAELQVEWGDFYSGDIVRTTVTPTFIPSKYFTLQVPYQNVRTRLDEGDFDTQLVSASADFAFTPEVSWKNLVQYDTESEDLGWQSRLHWIVEPGQDLFLVALFGWDKTDRESFRSTSQEATLKLTYTFRF